ncbi:delta-aminolevulinic acid dehydratase [Shouchella clausii]|uniref:delta-aminolevulinic acid dehydratase n=1 Tax=Shouchella clausii TaxID=79880 RepID=UPI000BA541F5|nr:delta-aminolevulinic acid dehydratase [Shouchella clausii]PAD90343.1 delta-aminolevulinic acid dehydratase [Shouchella clausii]
MSEPNMRITLAVGPNCELEAFSLRSVLEYYGARVHMHWIGRPNDLVGILSGKTRDKSDYLILCFHGEEGQFILPELAEDVYVENEPRSCYFGAEDVLQHAHLEGVHVVATGCTLGDKKLAEAFKRCKAESYIAPKDYVDGNASLLFVLMFMYELINNSSTTRTAFERAQAIDDETGLYQLFF